MIAGFKYITESKHELKVVLGIGDDLFEDSSKEDILRYYRSDSSGIKWAHGDREIVFFEKGQYITGYPTPALDKVIVFYPHNHPIHGVPHNAVIYKEDGTIYMQLQIPQLISSIATERRSQMSDYDIKNDASFRGAYWSKDGEGNLFTVVTIDFDWDWWESRILNPVTGEFGACVGSGRR